MSATPNQIDARGPRVSAAITFTVLVTAYLLQSAAILAVQVVVFAVAAIAGLRFSPYGNLFRLAKRQLDLPAPTKFESAAGPRFSQLLGMIFSGLGLISILSGAESLGWTLVLLVVALSGLLAATGICVGCELYAFGARLRGGTT